jgi:hypothetical protein
MMARLAALGAALAVLVALVAGCGYGPAADEGKISDAADTYLRSLADGDAAGACEQLTVDARAGLGAACEPAVLQIAARVGADRLDGAADRGLEIEVDDNTGSAVVSELDARLTLVRVGEVWRIDGGYRLDSR